MVLFVCFLVLFFNCVNFLLRILFRFLIGLSSFKRFFVLASRNVLVVFKLFIKFFNLNCLIVGCKDMIFMVFDLKKYRSVVVMRDGCNMVMLSFFRFMMVIVRYNRMRIVKYIINCGNIVRGVVNGFLIDKIVFVVNDLDVFV